MKNLLLVTICLFMGWHYSNAQFVEWSNEYTRYEVVDNSAYDPNRTFSIQLADHSVLLIENKDVTMQESFMPFGIRYDSLNLVHVNEDGTISWRKVLPFTGRGKIYNAKPTADGGFVCCGVQSTYLSIFKFDKNGNLVFLKQWPKPVQKIYPANIAVDANNNYYMLSAEFYFKRYIYAPYYWGVNYFDVYYRLTKTDAAGNILWTRNAGHDICPNSSNSIWYGSPVDTSDIKYTYEFDLLDLTPTNRINVVSLRAVSFDTVYGGITKELYLNQFDTAGNLLHDKAMLDSFNMPSLLSYNNYHEVVTNIYNFYGAICKIADGYFYKYSSNSSDTTYHELYSNYYQTFDDDGQKKDSVVTQTNLYYTDTVHDELNMKIPVYKDPGGNFISGNFVYEGSGQLPGSLVLNKYDPSFNLTAQTPTTIGTLYSDGVLIDNLFPASDGGILVVHKKITGDFDLNEPLAYRFSITKFGEHANSIFYSSYIDRNNNGIKDNADTVFTEGLVQTQHGQQTTEHLLTGGKSIVYTDTGTYTSRLISYYQHLKYYTIIPQEKTSTFTTYGNRDTVVFRLTPKPHIQDLQITVIPVNSARPGFDAYYSICVANHGTDTIREIPIRFLKDHRQSYVSTGLDSMVILNDTLTWMLDSLIPFQNFTFRVVCTDTFPPILDVGDTLSLQAWVLPIEPDSTKEDNAFLLLQDVRNSSDPNDKSESHGAGITQTQLNNGEYLYYTIRFQNTGNDWAYNIIVKDTLQENLDWSTFEMVNASGIYKLEVKDKRFITWTFYSIYLADSTHDEPNSHGYVSFRIKPKAGLSTHDVIQNRAAITFDFNQPVITNTATTQILEERITVIKNNPVKTIKLFPNPSDNNINLEINIQENGKYDLYITDLKGSIALQKTLNLFSGNNTEKISVADLPAGLYLISINTKNLVCYSGKLLKN